MARMLFLKGRDSPKYISCGKEAFSSHDNVSRLKKSEMRGPVPPANRIPVVPSGYSTKPAKAWEYLSFGNVVNMLQVSDCLNTFQRLATIGERFTLPYFGFIEQFISITGQKGIEEARCASGMPPQCVCC